MSLQVPFSHTTFAHDAIGPFPHSIMACMRAGPQPTISQLGAMGRDRPILINFLPEPLLNRVQRAARRAFPRAKFSAAAMNFTDFHIESGAALLTDFSVQLVVLLSMAHTREQNFPWPMAMTLGTSQKRVPHRSQEISILVWRFFLRQATEQNCPLFSPALSRDWAIKNTI